MLSLIALLVIFAGIPGYLIGSIPFGLILTKLFLKKDVREIGSGNIGATNVLRTGNKTLAAITLLLDLLKGVLAVYVYLGTGEYFFGENFDPFPISAGLFAILGHCFPIWLKFKGGKGVATTFGVLFVAVPWAGFLAAVAWGIVAGFTRYSSLAALSAIAMTPLFSFIYYGIGPTVFTAMIALLVFWRHKENIQRLMAGTESKIGSKKKDQNEPTADTE